MSHATSSGYESGQYSTTVPYDNNSNNGNRIDKKRQENQDHKHLVDLELQDKQGHVDTPPTIYNRIYAFDNGPYDRIPPQRNRTQAFQNGQRPLPAIPRNEPDANSKVPDKDRTSKLSYRKLFCIVMVIVPVLLLPAAAIYMKLSCFKDVFCAKDKPVPPYPPHSCDRNIQQDYGVPGTAGCLSEMINATTVMLQSGQHDTNTIDIEGATENNISMTLKGITVLVYRNSSFVSVDIRIEVLCTTMMTQVVTLSNGTINETYRIHVIANPGTQQCPCERQEDVGTKRFITCDNVNGIDNVTVMFHGDTANTSETLAKDVKISDIIGNRLNVTEDDALSIVVQGTSQLTFQLAFTLVKCDHGGIYVITLGNKTYEVKFTAKSYPAKPVISANHDQLGGLVEGKTGEVRCEAFVGCGGKPGMYEETFDGFQLINSRSDIEVSARGMTHFETVVQNPVEMALHGSKYKCAFSYNGVEYESDVFTAKVIPRSWCKTQNAQSRCHTTHPYDCDKWVACLFPPVEQLCQPGDHFYFENPGDCMGKCGHPEQAECSITRK